MRRLGRWLVPALLLAWWAPPALAAGQLPGARAAVVEQASPAPATPATTASQGDYAAREAKAQQLQQWTGGYEGGGVYIGGSAIALVLVIVLVVLLVR
jgi:hypothetical protein